MSKNKNVESKVSVIKNHDYELIDKLYQSLMKIIADKELNTTNIMNIMIELAQIVETYPEIHGEGKRDLILHVLDAFINDNVTNKQQKENLIKFINIFGPSAIDAFISLDKREIAIKIKKGFGLCFSC